MIADPPSPHPLAPDRLASLKAVVLLAGAVRENSLVRVARRPLLDLPLTPTDTVLSAWHQGVGALRASLGRGDIQFVLSTTSSPDAVQRAPAADMRVVVDAGEFRGTGGALRDLAEHFHPDDFLVVANAHSALLGSLDAIVATLLAADGDVVLHADAERVPSGIMLVRVGALLRIARRGFVDFKEQALPGIASQHQVRAILQDRPAVVPIRTLEGYLKALRLRNQPSTLTTRDDPFAEEWPMSFSLMEAGAIVAADARIHDSVVLSGANVERGAILVRCVVGPGARVGSDQFMCDQVLPNVGGDT